MSDSFQDLVNSIQISVGPFNPNRKIAVIELHTGLRGPKGDPGSGGSGDGGGSGSSSSPTLQIDSIPMSYAMLSAKQLTLTQTPTLPSSIMIVPDGGLPQTFGVDFSITNNLVSWNGFGLTNQLIFNDILFIRYYVGGSSSSIRQETIPITSGIIASKQITLSQTPIQPAISIVAPYEGMLQTYGIDYTISGNVLQWVNLGLESTLIAGDFLQVQYLV